MYMLIQIKITQGQKFLHGEHYITGGENVEYNLCYILKLPRMYDKATFEIFFQLKKKESPDKWQNVEKQPRPHTYIHSIHSAIDPFV